MLGSAPPDLQSSQLLLPSACDHPQSPVRDCLTVVNWLPSGSYIDLTLCLFEVAHLQLVAGCTSSATAPLTGGLAATADFM